MEKCENHYLEYPADNPFINTGRLSLRCAHAYPESNREAILKALKLLQKKLVKPSVVHSAAQSWAAAEKKHAAVEGSDLVAAETKCRTLERQLKLLQSRLDRFQDVPNLKSRSSSAKGQVPFFDLCDNMDPPQPHDADRLKVGAAQDSHKGAENEVPMHDRDPQHPFVAHGNFRNKTSTKRRHRMQQCMVLNDYEDDNGMQMYPTHEEEFSEKLCVPFSKDLCSKINLGSAKNVNFPQFEIGKMPFVTGKTTESHSLPVNVQQVLALMKICGTSKLSGEDEIDNLLHLLKTDLARLNNAIDRIDIDDCYGTHLQLLLSRVKDKEEQVKYLHNIRNQIEGKGDVIARNKLSQIIRRWNSGAEARWACPNSNKNLLQDLKRIQKLLTSDEAPRD